MTPQEFVEKYREYFGECSPLPLAVIYSDSPLGDEKSIPGCMFKQFHRAYYGETVTLDAENFTCGGSRLYAGLGSTPPGVYNFVLLVEKYRDSPETARFSIGEIDAVFSIPKSRFIDMCGTMSQCCVAGAPAWLKVRKRINTKG